MTAQGTSSARPETKYARSGDVHLAYQVFGEGDLDLVLVNGFTTHVELVWEHEPARRFLEGLASFARVINFDRRGSGLSDPVADAPTLEQRMDDVRAVMDAAGSERAALLGISEGASMSLLFAATYPHRVQALVCSGGMARSTWADDYPWASPVEALLESGAELVGPHWGEGAMIDVGAPSQADNPESRAFYARLERASASPGMLAALVRMFFDIDVRDVVPSVHVPTLVLHRQRDRLVNVRNGRWLAEHLPNARLVELPGDDHLMWYEDVDRTLGEIAGVPHRGSPRGRAGADRSRRSCSRTSSTPRARRQSSATSGGGTCWRGTSGPCATRSRASTAARSSRSGTGSWPRSTAPAARSAAPGRSSTLPNRWASLCAPASTPASVEVMGDDIGGIAVHIAARVSAHAGPGEVLVSRTVKDLVAGSGIQFSDRGVHTLKGIPDTWHLHAVVD